MERGKVDQVWLYRQGCSAGVVRVKDTRRPVVERVFNPRLALGQLKRNGLTLVSDRLLVDQAIPMLLQVDSFR